jgi:hypothetical protein
MKISFEQFLVLGALSVIAAATVTGKLLQTEIFKYRGHNTLALFLTRSASQEGLEYGPRLFTFWNLSHVLYYALGSYLFPEKRILLFGIGVAWELFEIPFGVFNFLDIFWNFIGILIGKAIRDRRRV